MVISHNIPALMTHLSTKKSNRALATTMQKLSSGFRINSAREDASGLAIANKLSYQIAGLSRASENASHGVALVQTAEGALNEVHNILQRMRELAVQAATGTMTAADKAVVQVEIDGMVEEIQATATRTEYNKIKILNGEGARITEALNAAGLPDNAVSSLLYISDAVSPGAFDYTITSVGEPAQLTWGGIPAGPATVAGSFSINGMTVQVEVGDTYNAVEAKILQACEYAGVDMWNNGGNTYLATRQAGSDQNLIIKESDPGVLAQFGFVTNEETTPGVFTAPGYIAGTDAVLSGLALLDQAGNPISGGLSYEAEGNHITVVGINGEKIIFNLQVINNKTTNTLTFGDGSPVTVPRGMSFSFKDYGPIKIQIGPSYNNNVSMHLPKLSAETMAFIEIKGGQQYKMLNYCTQQGANTAIGKMDDAIAMVSDSRARLGAFQNRLEATVRSLDIATENTQSAYSRVMDTDMAKEMTRYSQLNVMYQAGLAILGQANMRPQQILSLLQ